MHGVASLLLLHRHTHTHKKLTWCFFYSSGILWAGSCTGGDCENSFVCLSVELAWLVEKFLVDFDAAGWCDMLPLNSRAKPCVFNPPSSSTRDGGYVLCECFLVFSRFLSFFCFLLCCFYWIFICIFSLSRDVSLSFSLDRWYFPMRAQLFRTILMNLKEINFVLKMLLTTVTKFAKLHLGRLFLRFVTI